MRSFINSATIRRVFAIRNDRAVVVYGKAKLTAWSLSRLAHDAVHAHGVSMARATSPILRAVVPAAQRAERELRQLCVSARKRERTVLCTREWTPCRMPARVALPGSSRVR